MSNNKKYYYLKLKENFFNSDEIILIESMQDGMLFSNILLKLYLLSLKFNGFLRLNENMNYTAQMIASLLIIDDLGIERGTEYALEQVYNVIDTRYKSGRPLIVTTNLTLDELKAPADIPHKRIYDRVLGMCVPVMFNGVNFRKKEAAANMEAAKKLFGMEDKK